MKPLRLFLSLIFLLSVYIALPQMSSSALIEKAMIQLEINAENVEMRFMSEMPISDSEAILVFPEVVEQEEQYAIYNSHVLIVDRKDGSIKLKYSRKEEWVSDALGIQAINILLEPYHLSDEYQTFGILIDYYVQSRANPYLSKNLTLFLIKENKLERVLNDYIIHQFRGETNGMSDGKFEEIIGTIEAIKSELTFPNLKVEKTIQQTEILNGVEKIVDTVQSTEILHFKNGQYVKVK